MGNKGGKAKDETKPATPSKGGDKKAAAGGDKGASPAAPAGKPEKIDVQGKDLTTLDPKYAAMANVGEIWLNGSPHWLTCLPRRGNE